MSMCTYVCTCIAVVCGQYKCAHELWHWHGSLHFTPNYLPPPSSLCLLSPSGLPLSAFIFILSLPLPSLPPPPLDGSTVLHQAAYMNSSSIVALLLGLGADGLIKVSTPLTNLYHVCVCLSDCVCLHVCTYVVHTYVHMHIHTYIRTYVHHWFVMLCYAVLLTSACISERYVCTHLIISPPCLKDNEGRLPLHWATNNRSPQCIKLMLDKVRVDRESLCASVDKMICT